MKIVQTNKAYYPKIGGIETAVTTLSEGLANKYGAEVEVLVCNHKVNSKKIEKTINGVKVTYLPTYGFVLSLPISPSYPKNLLETSGDILNIHEPFPLADLTLEIFPKLRKNFSKIITSWQCDITRQKWTFPIYGKFIHRFLRKVDKIIVNNPKIIDNSYFLKHYKYKCEVVPIGINLDWAKSNSDSHNLQKYRIGVDNKLKILFVGRLVTYKGIEYLIESMKFVKDGFLYIIGSGPLENSLKKLIIDLNLESKIKMIPEVDDITLQAYYKACDIFVLPSVNEAEAYGIVQIEAMACGKPLICTELGTGTSYVNQNNITGLVVSPMDTKALSEAINRIIDNKELRLKWGTNGRARAFEEFTSDKMLQRTFELYQNLLKD
ncbi:MAG: glycosyltransferase [Ignavibacteriales bacterium]|nr:glycosyltransferase [Ignavibacteriales bacterium]